MTLFLRSDVTHTSQKCPKTKAMQQLRSSAFASFVQTHEICVIAFVRRGDSPSAALTRTLDSLDALDVDVAVGVVDVDRDAALAADFRVAAVPTVAVICRQELVFLEPGALPAEALNAVITAAADQLDSVSAR